MPIEYVMHLAMLARYQRKQIRWMADAGFYAAAFKQTQKALATEALVRKYADEYIMENMRKDCADVPF